MGKRIILDKVESHVSLGQMEIEEKSGEICWPDAPKVHILSGRLTYRHTDSQDITGVAAKALLDTGADVSLFSQQKRFEIERSHGTDLPVLRKVRISGTLRATYELSYILFGEHACKGDYGLVEAENGSYFDAEEEVDLFLGQDILNQFIVTFDGPNGTVTIELPDDSPETDQ